MMSSSNSGSKNNAALDLSSVKPADIILSTTKSVSSTGIRVSTCSDYSHAILVLNNGMCIEAMPGTGVQPIPLARALKDATVATHYRHKDINEEYRA